MSARAWKLGSGAAIVLLAGAWAAFSLRGRDLPAGERVRRLWAAKGIDRPDVVLITLDTTRADHLGCYGYADATTPSLDALAREGVLFAQASAVAPLTLPAHSSIMTGMYPPHHGVRVNGNTALGQEQRTLAEVLASRGYDTAAFVGAFVLDGRWGLNQGFKLYDDRFDLSRYKVLDLGGVQRPGDQVMDAALDWMQSRRDRPFFAWIHLYDPHTPYEPPEPFRSRYAARGMAGLYDGEIAFADQQVGRCLSWLRSSGLEQRTVIAVIGDHGEGLGSHGEGTHGYFVYDYALHVPFILRAPLRPLRGVRVASQVSAVDLFPTVLALANAGLAGEVHGRSLLPTMLHPQASPETYAYGESMTPSLQYGWSALHSLRSARYHLVKAPRPELYDLVADPQEQANVFDQQAALGQRLMARLDRLLEEAGRHAPAPESANLDQETVQRLAALGYVGAPVSAARADASRPLADPKDKLAVFTAVQEAGELITQEQHAAAALRLELALREEPRMPQARLMLGAAYVELGRTREAREQFDAVLKDDPGSVQALIGVAGLLLQEDRTEDVIVLCRRTLELDERNAQAHTLLGEAYAARHDTAQALASFERAVEIQPKLTRNRINLAGALIDARQYGRAESLLKEVVGEHPRFPLAQFNLGLVYQQQGRLAEARAAYAAEVAEYPRHFKARFNLGRVLLEAGDRQGAVEQMREVIRLAPRQPEGYLFLARALLQESAPPAQVEALAQQGLSLARAPDLKALGWYLLADVYNRQRAPERMREALRRAEAFSSAGSESRHAARHE